MKVKNDVIYGRKPIEEAFKHRQNLSKVFLQKGTTGPLEKLCRKHCALHQIPLSVVPREKLNRMVSGNHQGVVAWISPIEFVDLDQLVPHIFEHESEPLLIALDGVSDTRNLGAIVRSAWVLGAHGLLISIKDGAPINEFTVKSSAGAILHIPVVRTKSLTNGLEYLKESGYTLLAADVQGDTDLDIVDLKVPICLIMGSEGQGIGMHIKRLTDHLFRLPQQRDFDSLNVSVAAGISLFEINRVRKKSF